MTNWLKLPTIQIEDEYIHLPEEGDKWSTGF